MRTAVLSIALIAHHAPAQPVAVIRSRDLMAVAAEVSIDRPRLLAAIQHVEQHAWSDPGGAYAIQFTTWGQHTRLPYRFASIKEYADAWAEKHFDWLTRSLIADGYAVSPYSLAMCWRFGLEGGKSRIGRAQFDYGRRVNNLYHAR